MSYTITVNPSSTNTDKLGTQQAVLNILKAAYPYATFTKGSKGTWSVTIPDAPGAPPPPPPSGLLFSDSFAYVDGLITNEYAFYNPTDGAAVKNSNWDMTSGSVFAQSGAGWTGVPDDVNPNATSSNGNDSAIFRMTSKLTTFGNVAVSFQLKNNGFTSTTSTPAVAWDGTHIFLRYQSEFSLYYASVNRRDGNCVIKKKVPGGPSNGGTYYDISAYVSNPFPLSSYKTVKATIQTNSSGTVTIAIYVGGVLIVQATDNGIGGAPITNPGKTGIRGDNCNFNFDDFQVNAL